MKSPLSNQEATRLLERYYTGLITPEEMRRLTDFVCSDACPEGWQAERKVFEVLRQAPALPQGFSQRMEAAIRQTSEPAVAAQPRRRWLYVTTIVLVAACMCGLCWLLVQPDVAEKPTGQAIVAAEPAQTEAPTIMSVAQRDENEADEATHKAEPSAKQPSLTAKAPRPADDEMDDPDAVYGSGVATVEEAEAEWQKVVALLRETQNQIDQSLADVEEILRSI